MATTSRQFVRALATLFCIFIVATGVLAQSQATTGNIEGRVLDPKEAVVPGATVTATNQQTGLEKTATTGGGYFSFVNINQYRGFTANAVPGNITLLPALPATAFGLPRSINTPRQLQLAIKFDP